MDRCPYIFFFFLTFFVVSGRIQCILWLSIGSSAIFIPSFPLCFVAKGDLLPYIILKPYSNTVPRWLKHFSVLEMFYCFVQEKPNRFHLYQQLVKNLLSGTPRLSKRKI